jgi:NRPS condensation-like uncharacterized protein
VTRNTLAASPLDLVSLLLRSVSNQKLILMLQFDSHIDLAQLHLAVNRLQHRLPLIACQLHAGRTWPRWQRNSQADASTNIHFHDLGRQRPDIASQAATIAGYSKNTLDIQVFRQGGNDSLFVCVDHTLADAAGARELVYLLAQHYSWPGRNTNTAAPAVADSRRGLDEISRRYSSPRKIVSVLQYRAARGHWQALETSRANDGQPACQLRRLDGPKFARIREIGSLYGATINDLLVTSLFCALCKVHNVAAGEILPLQFTVDLRRYLESPRPAQVANLSGSEHIWLQTRPRSDFIATLLATNQALTRIKQRLPGLGSAFLLEKLFRTSYRGTSALLLKNFRGSIQSGRWNPLLTNLGRINANRLKFTEARVKDACLIGPSQLTPGLTVCASTFRDNLTLSVGYQPNCTSHVYVRNVLNEMAELLCGDYCA